jgi:predicted nucleic acid-binding Zn ribbon protein
MKKCIVCGKEVNQDIDVCLTCGRFLKWKYKDDSKSLKKFLYNIRKFSKSLTKLQEEK